MGRRSFAAAVAAAIVGSAAVASGEAPCDDSKIFARPVSEECPTQPGSMDWSAYSAELYDARNMLFSQGVSASRSHLAAILGVATSSAGLALQCPSAVAATSLSLAEVLTAEGAPSSNALALVHLAMSLMPVPAHRQCSQWPMQGRELSAAFLRLAQGAAAGPRAGAARGAPAAGGRRVALVTACAGPDLDGLGELSEENRRRYAELHGYDVYFFRSAAAIVAATPGGASVADSGDPAFWRARAVRNVAEGAIPYDWLLWLDCDALLTDPSRSVEALLSDLGLEDDDGAAAGETSLVFAADALGLRAEAWLLRPTPWSRDLLRRWTSRLPVPGALALGERAALRHALLPHWDEWLEGTPRRHDWRSVRWPREVRLALSGSLLAPHEPELGGLPAALAPLARPWREGDFAWHDPLCRGGKAPAESCLGRRARAQTAALPGRRAAA